jgi:hypothetical protein
MRFVAIFLPALGLCCVAPSVAAEAQPAAGQASVRFIEQSAKSVRVELRAARVQGDRVRARCVSEKLTEVHAQLRLAEQHAPWIDTRDARIDPASARRHGYVLSRAKKRARDLVEQARHCSMASTPAFQLTITDSDGNTQIAHSRR